MRALLALAVLAFGAPLAAGDAPLASAAVRTTFVVSDIDRSVGFYHDVFGYSVVYEGEIGSTPENRTLLALAEGDSARFVILDGERNFPGRDHVAMGIGLLSFPGQRTPRLRQPRGNRFASGQAMLAIMTSDIAAVIERLRDRGAPIIAGPVTGHGGRETEIVTIDPDGTRLHVVEQRPAG